MQSENLASTLKGRACSVYADFLRIFSPYTPYHVDMGRKLKFHEGKLLKKVDFISWKVDKNVREIQVLKRYRITKREDYSKLVFFCFFPTWYVINR